MTDDPLFRECRAMADRAKNASRAMAISPGAARDAWLGGLARSIAEHADAILAANARDVEAAPDLGLNAAAIDRLRIDRERLLGAKGLAHAAQSVRDLPDPLGEVVRGSRRPNGLEVQQIRVPLGVVFMIYESRPNVTLDAAALCLKSATRRSSEAARRRSTPTAPSTAPSPRPRSWRGAVCPPMPSSSSRRPTARPWGTC